MKEAILFAFIFAFILGAVWLYLEDFYKDNSFYINIMNNPFVRGDIIACDSSGSLLIVLAEGDCLVKVKPYIK